jgi:succinyl-CoA synthetase beta subunit
MLQVGVNVPLIVRLEGTNVELGKKILEDAAASMPTLISATDLDDAAIKAVKSIS